MNIFFFFAIGFIFNCIRVTIAISLINYIHGSELIVQTFSNVMAGVALFFIMSFDVEIKTTRSS